MFFIRATLSLSVERRQRRRAYAGSRRPRYRIIALFIVPNRGDRISIYANREFLDPFLYHRRDPPSSVRLCLRRRHVHSPCLFLPKPSRPSSDRPRNDPPPPFPQRCPTIETDVFAKVEETTAKQTYTPPKICRDALFFSPFFDLMDNFISISSKLHSRNGKFVRVLDFLRFYERTNKVRRYFFVEEMFLPENVSGVTRASLPNKSR